MNKRKNVIIVAISILGIIALTVASLNNPFCMKLYQPNVPEGLRNNDVKKCRRELLANLRNRSDMA